MISNIQEFIEYIGSGNLVSIFLFMIGIFYAFYIYYKSFYRLVFTQEKTCENIKKIYDWNREKTEFVSRVIFYNNGRKTITQNEISFISIFSPEIIDYKIINKQTEKIEVTKESNNKLNIKLNHLDSSNYIILEIIHKGLLKISGRISETGEILNTETIHWKVVNIVLIISMFGVMFYNLFSNSSKTEFELIMTLFYTALIFGATLMVVRFIHRLLFIPDNITSRYLGTTDKFNTEFKNEL